MAVALGTATALVAGHMSDRIGGKKSLLAGCGLAAPTYVPSKHFDIDAERHD
jgi:MFS family permease